MERAGRHAAVARTPTAIEATITFPPLGASRVADEFCALAKAGVLSAVSVGFQSRTFWRVSLDLVRAQTRQRLSIFDRLSCAMMIRAANSKVTNVGESSIIVPSFERAPAPK